MMDSALILSAAEGKYTETVEPSTFTLTIRSLEDAKIPRTASSVTSFFHASLGESTIANYVTTIARVSEQPDTINSIFHSFIHSRKRTNNIIPCHAMVLVDLIVFVVALQCLLSVLAVLILEVPR
eukprot:m.21791 g.21791  ORF g.21791 m.21791 type:complete len:125 (-) comp5389_c0_seq3:1421-1795(-)